MPRTSTIELLYLPVAAEACKIGAAKEVLGVGNKQPIEKIKYQIDQPLEPILFTLYIPKIKLKKEKSTLTLFLEDVTGAAQIIQEAFYTNMNAGESAKAGPIVFQRRIIPAKDLTVEPELDGGRQLTIQAESSSEEDEIPANTAKCVAYLKIDGLARQ